MNDQELKDNARKRLEVLCPIGTHLFAIRIDEGRRGMAQSYFAVLCDTDAELGLQNISGVVARLIGRKWSNSNGTGWANSSGVLHRNVSDLVDELACELHGIDANLSGKSTLTYKRL